MASRVGVLLVGLMFTALLGGLGASACSATGKSEFSSASSAAGASTNGSGGALTTIAVGVGGGTSCALTCSADLKKVIDCNGELIETCSGDVACLGGTCSGDPCAAAEASKSSYGCDYWALKPDLIAEAQGACFAAFIANTWSSPVHIEVFRQGQQIANNAFIVIPQGQGKNLGYAPYQVATGLPVGEVAIVFLSREPAGFGALPDCPAPSAYPGESAVNGTGRGQAFHIKTDRPVVAYSILPYGGGPSAATSASLLLPTSAWDTNYIAVNAYKQSVIAQSAGAQPSLDILASEDGTEVTILPKVAILAGPGVLAAQANTPVTYQLNAGEYLQLSQPAELTGSPIQSNKPIGLWGGASCLNIPVDAPACDSAHQQIPPVKALGHRYAMVRYRNRKSAVGEESPPWRLVGAVDGTQLTWTPAPPPGAPGVLGLGQVYEFNGTGPYDVTSQDSAHPFYVAQYMTGADSPGMNMGLGEGDPEWVNVVPVEQYLDEYVFFTDPTYSETSLVIVRQKSKKSGQFADVTLDCAGVLTGWQPLGELEFTRVDLVTGDFQNVGNCSNGRHQIGSTIPFGMTVWGWGGYSSSVLTKYVSYAYPAGASVQTINEVVVPPTPD
ncbi:MAG: hypothetical protein EXR75_03745 [Myxococcales bacterium]|nr:hypothetical protein [Myxococcales bacterium]